MTSFCFDLDGTLCTNTYGAYEQARPHAWAIDRVNALRAAGHRVLIFTARGSSTGIDWSERTRAQLHEWGVGFDELCFGKPTADVFIDDRAYGWDAWRWGHPAVIAGPGIDDPERARAMAQGILGFPGPFAFGPCEIGRTFGGRAMWLDDHLDALLAGRERDDDRATLLARLRVAIEPPGGTLGDAGEVIFTLHLPGQPNPAYLDAFDEDARASVAVSCRPWMQAASALPRHRPTAAWPGVVALSVGSRTIRGHLDADVTVRRIAAAARAAGFEAVDGPPAPQPGEEQVLVCAPFPVLAPGDVGPATRRLAEAVAAATGIDPLRELGR